MGKATKHHTSSDRRLLGLCRQLAQVDRQLESLEAADQWAPDRGPLHPEFQHAERERDRLEKQIGRIDRIHTLDGMAAVARMILTHPPGFEDRDPLENMVLFFVASGFDLHPPCVKSLRRSVHLAHQTRLMTITDEDEFSA